MSAQRETPAQYRALSPLECLCLAMEKSEFGDLGEEEAALVRSTAQCAHFDTSPEALEARRTILKYLGLEAKNQTGAAALLLYYALAEAEGKAELLTQSLPHLREGMAKTEKMREQDLRPPVEQGEYLRQTLTMQGNLIELDGRIDQGNLHLQQLLGYETCSFRWRVWNPSCYKVKNQPIDVEHAVAYGLAHRPELVLLRYLIRNVDKETLPSIRSLLKTVHPALGQVAASRAATLGGVAVLLGRLLVFLGSEDPSEEEIHIRREQLKRHLKQREREVARKIRQAIRKIGVHVRLANLAHQRTLSRKEKLEEVRKRQQQDLTSFVEVIAVTLEWMKVRAEVVEQVMAWNRAWVELRKAQGILPDYCGEASQAPVCPDPAPAPGHEVPVHHPSPGPSSEWATQSVPALLPLEIDLE